MLYGYIALAGIFTFLLMERLLEIVCKFPLHAHGSHAGIEEDDHDHIEADILAKVCFPFPADVVVVCHFNHNKFFGRVEFRTFKFVMSVRNALSSLTPN